MKTLRLAPNFQVPMNAVTQTWGFLAKKGGGKTHNAGVLVEQLVRAGAPVCVIDPIGNWYGLQLGRDGKSKGLDIPVFGGRYGDIPILETQGEMLAKLVVSKNISCVIDIEPWSKAARARFVTAFLGALYDEAKNLNPRKPRMVVLEEAHFFAPQRLMREQNKVYSVVEELVRQGRNYGLGCTLISQRPQSINKEVLSQVECLCVGQLGSELDRKAIRGWIVERDLKKEWVADLVKLEPGEMVVWSPSWLKKFEEVKFDLKTTYDSSSTPEFDGKDLPIKMGRLELSDLRKAFEALAKPPVRKGTVDVRDKRKPLEYKEGANTHFQDDAATQIELRNKLARLAWFEKQWPLMQDLVRRLEGIRQAQIQRVSELMLYEKMFQSLQPMFEKLDGTLKTMPLVHTKPVGEVPTPPGDARQPAKPMPNFGFVGTVHDIANGAKSWPARTEEEQDDATEDKLPPGAHRMLQVLALFTGPMTKAQIARGAKMKQSGTFANYWGRLNRREYLEKVDGDKFRVTDAGMDYLGMSREPIGDTFEGRLQFWRGRTPPGAMHILDTLIANPQGLSKPELAAAAGFSESGTFSAYLSTLRTCRLISGGRGGDLKVSKYLLEGAD